MKKLASLALALAMCLALAIPAFAAASTQKFNTENSSLLPTVELTMPTSGVVILNPYKMQYSGTALTTLSGDALKAQILSVPFSVTNKTQGAKLKVSVAVTGVTAGNATLEPTSTVTSIDASEKTNKVILNLDCGVTQDAAAAAPTSVPTDVKTTMRVKAEEQKFSDIILNEATDSTFTYITFLFSGYANDHPETPWASKDTVGARFVFTFEPVATDKTASNAVSVQS